MKTKLPTTGPLSIACAVALSIGSAGLAAAATLYSNNFESYTTGNYPSPSNPLPGWNAMSSNDGLVPSITPTVGASGQSLMMDAYGGGATGWMSVSTPVLAGSTSDWSVAADARYLGSNHTPWYGSGGLLLSSTGSMTGDYIWLAIESGWGEINGTTTWARPQATWSLGGVTGGGTLFPWAPPAGVVVTEGNAMRMSTDTWGPAALTVSRTGGASTISYSINTPVDGPFAATLSFSGGQAAALNNLTYVGFANYLNEWEYDNLVVQGIPEPSTVSALLGGLGTLLLVRRRQRG